MDRDDDLDDLLDGRKAEVEERFRELEHEEEIERLREKAGAPRRPPQSGDARPGGGEQGAPGPNAAPGDDPLADLKAAVSGSEVERYLLVECPHCQGKNRVALSKLRRLNPVCGRCKQELAFVK